MLKTSLHICFRQLASLLAITLVFFISLVVVFVWLSDSVATRKNEIADWLSNEIAYPVTIEEAGITWLGLLPKLDIANIEIATHDAEAAIAKVEHLYIDVDLFASLIEAEPVISDIGLAGVRFSVTRTPSGEFHLDGVDSKSSSSKPIPELLREISWFKHLAIQDLEVSYLDKQQTDLSGVYQLKTALLTYENFVWQYDLSLQPSALGQTIHAIGTMAVTEQYEVDNWDIDVDTEQLVLPPLLQNTAFKGAVLQSGTFAGQLHISDNPTEGLSVKSQFDLQDVKLTSSTKKSVAIDALSGQVLFQKQQEQWHIQVSDFQLRNDDGSWPENSQLDISRHSNGLVEATANYLKLTDLTPLALLIDDSPEVIKALHPAGEIRGLAMRYQDGLQALSFQADKLVVSAWQQYPGFNELSFQLDWSPVHANLEIDSHALTIFENNWLKHAVYFDSVSGQLDWNKAADGWQLQSTGLNIWNDDFNLNLDGRVSKTNQNLDSDLRLDILDLQLNRWQHYFPTQIIPIDARKWLTQAFLAGQIKTGFIEMSGNPQAFPFDTQPDSGRFNMHLETENVSLHYAPGWPDLSGVTAVISGHGNDLLVESQQAEIAGMKINTVTTTIENLVRAKPVCRVKGSISGSTENALNVLAQSPLQNRFGLIPDILEGMGESDIQLELMVPLVHVNDTEVKGQVIFKDSAIKVTPVDRLELSRINGALAFDNDGVRAEAIQAVAFNEPVGINVIPKGKRIDVDLAGNTSVEALRQVWPELFPSFISGSTDYLSKLIIQEQDEGDFSLDIGVGSDLLGVTIDMPPPFGKTASVKKDLNINVEVKEQMRYRVEYDNLIDTDLIQQQDNLKGEIRLGGGKASADETDYKLVGKIDQLELEAWLDWHANQPNNDQQLTLPTVDLEFGKASFAKHMLTDLNMKLTHNQDQSLIALDSPQVRGSIVLPDTISSTQRVEVDLDYLKLTLPESTREIGSRSLVKQSLWPSIKLNIDEFYLNTFHVGHVSLDANNYGTRWVVNQASIEAPHHHAELTGQWVQTPTNEYSEINTTLNSGDVADLLENYGYQQVIEANRVKIDGQLKWQGDPSAFAPDKLEGKLNLDVGQGVLVEVEPGAAGRIFGLLSFSAIPRRLSLDFRELFGKGFGFRAITGQFDLANGLAKSNDLKMDGDSAEINITGTIDLANQSYDQIVKITPEVSSTLPIAGAAAGGVVGLGIGAAVLVLDKVADNVLDKKLINQVSFSYTLTGPWQDPQFSVLKAKQENEQNDDDE